MDDVKMPQESFISHYFMLNKHRGVSKLAKPKKTTYTVGIAFQKSILDFKSICISNVLMRILTVI